jgi:hypothetical protein
VSERLATTIALYAIFLAGWAMLSALAVRERGPALTAGLVVLELALVVQALLAGGTLLGGHRPEEAAVFSGYLAVSVAILPAVGGRAGRRRASDTLVVAIACVALAVVCWRLVVTWEAGA